PRSRFAAANPERTFGLEEAFNSVDMRRTRLAMLAGERVKACTYCYDREDGGGESYRQKVNRIFGEMLDLPALVATTAADGSLDAFPLFLDIRFGNTCNLQCIMCGYPVSSRWGTEKRPTWAQANIDPYRDDDELWDVLRENACRLGRVYFAGGEPFMQPGHFKMLDLLIETGSAAGIDLVYNSNLTVLPKGVFEQLAQFKSVGIGASCDGSVRSSRRSVPGRAGRSSCATCGRPSGTCRSRWRSRRSATTSCISGRSSTSRWRRA
ncbi:MAG: twitch domain-containing radical SAM protein, partial [Pseudonocardiaceae bacterium]